MSFLVNLRGKIENFFSGSKTNEHTSKKISLPKLDIENSSLGSLIDVQERKNNAILRWKYLQVTTNMNYKLSSLTLIYWVLNISLLIVLLSLRNFNNTNVITGNNDVDAESKGLADFFHLELANPIIFNIFTIATAMVGFIIVTSIFIIAKNERQTKIIKSNKFSLYMTLIFGLFSQFLHVIIGYHPFFKEVNQINKFFKKEFSVELHQLIFISYLITFELFAVFATIEISTFQVTNVNLQESNENWNSYKLITLMYLIIFTAIYIFVFLHKSGFLPFG